MPTIDPKHRTAPGTPSGDKCMAVVTINHDGTRAWDCFGCMTHSSRNWPNTADGNAAVTADAAAHDRAGRAAATS
jgi:hypothetical protein